MKKAVLKKVAIGVAVLLASVAIIAVVSSLFSGNKSSGSARACTHETRASVNNTEATCTTAGTSGSIRCLDCGKIVVEGEELPPTGHTGEVGEVCRVCKEPIYGRYQNSNFYREQAVSASENVAGNWYRLYNGCWLNLSAEIENSIYETHLSLFALGDGEFTNTGRYNYVSWMGHSTGTTLNGMKVYIEEDYIDVYLAPGVYALFKAGSGYTTEITAETTITSLSGTVRRLVFESNEEQKNN